MDVAAQGCPRRDRLYGETWIKNNTKVDGPPPGKHDGPFEARQRCGIGASFTNIGNSRIEEVPIEVFGLKVEEIEIDAGPRCGIGSTNINNNVRIEVFDLNGKQIEISDTVTSIEALKEEISQKINTFSGFIQLIGPKHKPLNDFDSVSTVFVLVSKQPIITRLLEDAIEVAKSIPHPHKKEDALQLIAGEQAAFDVNAAIKTADEIKMNPVPKAKALLAIAREQANTDPETANTQLETAKNLVIDRRFIHKDDQPFSLITNPNIKVRALCDIASEQANTDSNAANETLNDAKNIANKIPFNNNKAMALLAIASTKVKTNSANANQTFNSAIAAAQSIPEPYQKADALRLIASEQAAFDVKAAIETANEIDVSDSQAKALLAIAHSIRLTLTQ